MRSLLVLFTTDLRLRLRDRSLLLYVVVAPLTLALVLGGIFGSLDDGVELRIGAVVPEGDQFGTTLTRQVLPSLADAGVVAEAEVLDDAEAARDAIERGELAAALVVPDGFTRGVQSGAGGTIEVLADPGSPTASSVAESIAEGFASELSAASGAAAVAAAGGGDPASVAAAVAQQESLASLTTAPVDARELDATTYLSAGMAVFFLLFGSALALTSLLADERRGLLARLRSLPMHPGTVVAAKFLLAFVVGVASLLVLAVLTTLLLGAEWGDPWAVLALSAAASAAGTAIVALVASLVQTAEAAQAATGVVATVLGAVGGTFFPIAGGGLLDAVSRLTPHRWFLDGLAAASGGGGLAGAAVSLLVLVGLTLLFGLPATLLLRRRYA